MASLAELPPTPERSGWPWTAAAPPLAGAWPSLSIITPSFNQAAYLEETLRSVLLQGYPELEYIVIDGGSTDGSVPLLERYAPWLAAWVSEPDRGQAEAINKGFARATGAIVAWLNSDDTYCPGALAEQAGFLRDHADVDVVYGDCVYTDAHGRPVQTAYGRPFTDRELLRFTLPYQPTVFMRRAVLERCGGLDPAYHYTLDSELWLRLRRAGARFAYHPRLIATYRLHDASKTVAGVAPMHADMERLITTYGPAAARRALLADARLQTGIKLALAGQPAASWHYARTSLSAALRPRLLAYALAVLEGLTGQPLYSRWVARRMRALREAP